MNTWRICGLKHPLVETIFRILGIFQVNSLFKIIAISDPLVMMCSFESNKRFLIFNGFNQSGNYWHTFKWQPCNKVYVNKFIRYEQWLLEQSSQVII